MYIFIILLKFIKKEKYCADQQIPEKIFESNMMDMYIYVHI